MKKMAANENPEKVILTGKTPICKTNSELKLSEVEPVKTVKLKRIIRNSDYFE